MLLSCCHFHGVDVAVVVEEPEVVEPDAEADPVVDEAPDVPEPEVLAAEPADPTDPIDPVYADPFAVAGAGVTLGGGNGVCNET